MTTQLPPPNPTFDLPGSLFVVNTGQGNNGKTYQMMRLLQAVVPGTTRPAVAPTLMLVVEASAEGTAGDLLADESACLVWPVATFEEAQRVLTTCFPWGLPPLTLAEARRAKHKVDCERAAAAKRPAPPPPGPTARDSWPLRSVGVDSVSTLHRAQKAAISNAAREESARKHRGRGATEYVAPSISGRDLENDQKRVAGLAARPAQDFVDALSALTARYRGLLVVVSCHTRPQVEVSVIGGDESGKGGERTEAVVGEAPDFGAPKAVKASVLATGYADLWNTLHAKANICWHLYAKIPDLLKSPEGVLNDEGKDVTFGAVTMRGLYPGLGQVGWPKRQGGGWLRYFDVAPRVWRAGLPWPGEEGFLQSIETLPSARDYQGGPDQGLLLELCLSKHAARG